MLTPEQEKFVSDLFSIHQKKQQVNALAIQRETAEAALVSEYKVDELNTKRANINSDYYNSTNQIQAEITQLEANLTK